MDLKLIISTFFVIFLAELGDKTQFAAMAASAGCNKPVSILIGSVLALSLSSVIAVAAGSLIGNLIPARYIKIAAGVLFIVFGLLYLKEAFGPEVSSKAVPKEDVCTTIIENPILRAAQGFENAEVEMLRSAREKITKPGCLEVLDSIIAQELGHINVLQSLTADELHSSEEDLLKHKNLNSNCSCGDAENELLAELYERECSMAEFYRIMSEKTKIASVRLSLMRLFEEEKEHAKRIGRLIDIA
ncbi:MAG: TMEM165/GDT1 family protein [Spirochaetales bacterium]|nr:TMEM165/GDT1 family protein [Spirochaetales bacterium]